MAVHTLLRSFAEKLRRCPGGGPHPAQRTIASAQPGTFFDLTCKVQGSTAAWAWRNWCSCFTFAVCQRSQKYH